MSNYRAIAAVTAALSEMIAVAIDGVLPMATVTNLRPGAATAGDTSPPSVNVYLYRAEPNGSLRNVADPVRLADGRLVRRPVSAWNLQYLLTCIGAEEALEPEILLGAVVTALNANPTLASGLLANVDATLTSETGNRKYAAGSELEQQADRVRVTPIDLSLETLTQLWSSITSEPYALSVAYQAGVVLMLPDMVPQPALPVAGQPSAVVATLNIPRITAVIADTGPQTPIVIASTLVLTGQSLRGENTRVHVGPLVIELASDEITDGRIELELSPEEGGTPKPRELEPGVHGVRVSHWMNVAAEGKPPQLRPAATSNVVPIVLRPTITAEFKIEAAKRKIIVTVAPKPDPAWEGLLLLNEVGIDHPRARVLDSWTLHVNGEALIFDASAVPVGDWLVRLQVNGAESPLERGPDGVYAEPKVTVS